MRKHISGPELICIVVIVLDLLILAGNLYFNHGAK